MKKFSLAFLLTAFVTVIAITPLGGKHDFEQAGKHDFEQLMGGKGDFEQSGGGKGDVE